MSSENFEAYSQYYDLLYGDKPYEQEAQYVSRLLQQFGCSGGSILELGCGTGGHASEMVKLGYRVHGVDLSSEMIKRAVKTAGFSCECGDALSLRLNQEFDAVCALFHVASYQTENRQILSLLETAACHLQPGGLFIFDFWFASAVLTQRPSVRLKEMSNTEIRVLRVASPEVVEKENLFNVNYTIFHSQAEEDSWRVIKETHSMRYFSLPEIELLCDSAGFDLVKAEEFLSGDDPSPNTWGVCAVLRKRGVK